MQERHIFRLVAVPVLIFVFGICAVVARIAMMKKQVADVEWGKGILKASEKAYYEYSTYKISNKWNNSIREHERNRDGRPKDGYEIYLVIDTTIPAMWLEDKGEVMSGYYAEMPKNMKWKRFCNRPEGNENLPEVIRLKKRGVYSDRSEAETICLHGYGRANDSFNYQIHSWHISAIHGDSNHNFQRVDKKPKKHKDPYKSIIVSNEEWKAYQDKYGAAKLPSVKKDSEKTPGDQWAVLQKHIYRQVEQEVLKRGYKVRRFEELHAGKDFKLAVGKVNLDSNHNSGLFGGGGWLYNNNLVKARLIEGGIWHVRCYPENTHSSPNAIYLDFDFLLSTGQLPDKKTQKRLLKQAKAKYVPEPPIKKDWMVTLNNGVKVELLGICRRPSLGGEWWGPDGTKLPYEPDFGSTGDHYSGSRSKSLDAAFRVYWPAGTQSSKLDIKELSSKNSGGWSSSRGGTHMEKQIITPNFYIKKDEKSFGVQIEISINGGNPEKVIFKGIPVEAGKGEGFKIEKAE